MTNRNFLFLDFDGVLNSTDNRRANLALWRTDKAKYKSKDDYGWLFDERCVNWLRWICLRVQCDIIFTTTWRKYLSTLALLRMWNVRNMPGRAIGSTPKFTDMPRGYEIDMFLKFNECNNYCIIDDKDDMTLDQMPHLVQTNPMFGITAKDAKKVVDILSI